MWGLWTGCRCHLERSREICPSYETVILTDPSTALGMTDPETKLKYEHDMMTEKDYYSILNTYRDEGKAEGIVEGIAKGKEEGKADGVKEGLEKGIEKGRNEGQEKEKIKIATTMLKMGLSVETIMQATGLSAGEVAALQ